MLTIEGDIDRRQRRLPAVVRIGIVVLVVAGLADVVAHLGTPGADATGHAADEAMAHLAGLVGMVLVLAGVVSDGVRRSRRGQ